MGSRFAIVPTHWLHDPSLALADRALLAILATFGNEDRFCYPSVSHLCQLTGMDDRTVQRSLKRLEAAGAIAIERRYEIKNGRQTSNGYWLKGYDTPAVTSDTPVTRDGGEGVTHDGGPPSPVTPLEQDQLTGPVEQQQQQLAPVARPRRPRVKPEVVQARLASAAAAPVPEPEPELPPPPAATTRTPAAWWELHRGKLAELWGKHFETDKTLTARFLKACKALYGDEGKDYVRVAVAIQCWVECAAAGSKRGFWRVHPERLHDHHALVYQRIGDDCHDTDAALWLLSEMHDWGQRGTRSGAG